MRFACGMLSCRFVVPGCRLGGLTGSVSCARMQARCGMEGLGSWQLAARGHPTEAPHPWVVNQIGCMSRIRPSACGSSRTACVKWIAAVPLSCTACTYHENTWPWPGQRGGHLATGCQAYQQTPRGKPPNPQDVRKYRTGKPAPKRLHSIEARFKIPCVYRRGRVYLHGYSCDTCLPPGGGAQPHACMHTQSRTSLAHAGP